MKAEAMNDMSAGEWLRQELNARGISVRAATEAVGLKATQAVYAWMSDKAAPTDEAATKLAELLDVPEVEVRKRFGLWTPAEQNGQQPATVDRQALLQIRRELLDILERLDRMQQGE
jgi:transcriptional regulator with XRE-family HTH domain